MTNRKKKSCTTPLPTPDVASADDCNGQGRVKRTAELLDHAVHAALARTELCASLCTVPTWRLFPFRLIPTSSKQRPARTWSADKSLMSIQARCRPRIAAAMLVMSQTPQATTDTNLTRRDAMRALPQSIKAALAQERVLSALQVTTRRPPHQRVIPAMLARGSLYRMVRVGASTARSF